MKWIQGHIFPSSCEIFLPFCLCPFRFFFSSELFCFSVAILPIIIIWITFSPPSLLIRHPHEHLCFSFFFCLPFWSLLGCCCCVAVPVAVLLLPFIHRAAIERWTTAPGSSWLPKASSSVGVFPVAVNPLPCNYRRSAPSSPYVSLLSCFPHFCAWGCWFRGRRALLCGGSCLSAATLGRHRWSSAPPSPPVSFSISCFRCQFLCWFGFSLGY